MGEPMAKIVLISCGSKKLSRPAKAKDLYISPLFRMNLKYAHQFSPQQVYILSAKYGLLRLDDKIEPYDVTLNEMSVSEQRNWANKVVLQLQEYCDLENDYFIILAGEKYRQYLLPHFKFYEVPLAGLTIGKQLQFLKEKTIASEICEQLHSLFNRLPRYQFPFDESTIPRNGIYILFEKEEYAHGVDRIVRVGTHTGKNQLLSRLNQHFVKENKDRSIFRKNIGRAILQKTNDHFLEQWNWDLTTRKAKERYLPMLDEEKQRQVEKVVTEYIQCNFSFVVFSIDSKEERLKWEQKIISTVSLCKICRPSPNWLGLHSPKEAIRKSGMWLVNGLYKEPLSYKELEILKKMIGID